MLQTLFCIAVVLVGANGGIDQPVAVPPLPAQDAQTYAECLTDIVNRVATDYVRPIPRHQLFFAALSGLYEATGTPVPEVLQTELERAIKDFPLAEESPPDAKELLQTLLTRQAIECLAPVRQKLGDRDGLRQRADLRASIQAMMRMLDTYSLLVDGKELRRGNGEPVGGGLGIEFDSSSITGPLVVKSIVPGSPAQRAGLRPGERITHVNREPVAEGNRALMVLALTTPATGGKTPEEIGIKVLSAEDKSRRVKLNGHDFTPETAFGVRRDCDERWNYLLDTDYRIGYVRIGALDHGTADQIHQAVSKLKEDDIRGLILDLRWSPGGFLGEAVLITRLFIKEGGIATVRSRNQKDDQAYRADGDSSYLGEFPMVVLVNGDTSGGAELIAAALQDHKRALVAGQRTFGKASVQTMVAMPVENLGLRLTTGSFIRPSGKALHRFPDSQPKDDWGVRPEPDLDLPLSPDLSKQLRDWWLLHSLRPHKNNAALPVDDPDNDPQRQAALSALRKMLE
jgi:carboxyl-terminal processing protease